MPVICLGPVCIPLHLLLPFLVGLLHRYGYFKWFKAEWVTWRFWRPRIMRLFGGAPDAAPEAGDDNSSAPADSPIRRRSGAGGSIEMPGAGVPAESPPGPSGAEAGGQDKKLQ